jgi:superfamily II DNA or RNA helicase
MVRALIPLSARELRALIAAGYLGDLPSRTEVGDVTLRWHQRDAIGRIRALMHEHGGALLADEVGLGKTYVAAAFVSEAERALVVVPAALRPMWRDALRATGSGAAITSYTALSRGVVPAGAFDLVVLDEAHHARTPSTRRYRALEALTAHARVLLLSATPIHNRLSDLAAPLALFLGERAHEMDESELARCVVRRGRGDVAESARLPTISPAEWLSVDDDGALLERIVTLPPPVPPSDGGDGGALLTLSLVRQWASSRAALAAALRRRLARGTALVASLEAGRYPSRADLASWSYSDDALQLAFPELLSPLSAQAKGLLPWVRSGQDALRALLRAVESSDRADASRAAQLGALRVEHRGEKIVAFAHYAETVAALYRRLRAAGAVAALGPRGGLVAGGTLSRRATIERFAPLASGVSPPAEAHRIDLLLTTDLLSEGLNLHDASVVVHLDLPWSPARLEQRVGRSARLGASHATTSVYALRPPAAAESLLRIEQLLRDKLRVAGRTLGVAGSILPAMSLVPDLPALSETQLEERIRQKLALWRSDVERRGGIHRLSMYAADSATCAVAAVRAERSGILALLHDGEHPLLVAALGDIPPTPELRVVLEALSLATTDEVSPHENLVASSLERLDRWRDSWTAWQAAGGTISMAAAARRRAMRRIAAITARAPVHRRPRLAALASAARAAVTGSYGIGVERVLADLVAADLPDEAWLVAMEAFGSLHGRRRARHEQQELHIDAVLLLVTSKG